MTTQLHLSLGLTPEQVLADSEQRHGPFVARYALISGGRDSSVLAHACRHAYEAAAFIDTGTALPGVREHVERLASWLDKPLVILETPRSEYDRLVVGSTQTRSGGRPDVAAGFPGPPLHGSCYTRLKERQIERLLADAKRGHSRRSRVLFLTGLRRAESPRRRRRPPINRKHGAAFANALIDWTNADVAEYAQAAAIPESDSAALLHRSGECNCGAFAVPGERAMIAALFPAWFADRIAPLEAEAAELGLGALATWGHGIRGGRRSTAGGLCSACPAPSLFAPAPPEVLS